MTELSDQELKNRLLVALMDHIGRANAIGMGELYEKVFGQPYQHRINDTRNLRYLITEMKKKVNILSVCTRDGGGYYIASTASEAKDGSDRLKKKALKILAQAARLDKVGLPELLGQIRMNLEG